MKTDIERQTVFAKAIVDAVEQALRKAAPLIPDVTQEFLFLYNESLDAAFASVRERFPRVLREMDRLGIRL